MADVQQVRGVPLHPGAIVLPEPYLRPLHALRRAGGSVVWMDTVLKVNKVRRQQVRLVVVTATHLYTCLPDEGDIQRCVPLAAITMCHTHVPAGRTQTVPRPRSYSAKIQAQEQEHCAEVFLVCPTEYDLYFHVHEATYLQFMQALTAPHAVQKRVSGGELQRTVPVHPHPHPLSSTAAISAKMRLEKPPRFVRVSAEPLVARFTKLVSPSHAYLAPPQSLPEAQATPASASTPQTPIITSAPPVVPPPLPAPPLPRTESKNDEASVGHSVAGPSPRNEAAPAATSWHPPAEPEPLHEIPVLRPTGNTSQRPFPTDSSMPRSQSPVSPRGTQPLVSSHISEEANVRANTNQEEGETIPQHRDPVAPSPAQRPADAALGTREGWVAVLRAQRQQTTALRDIIADLQAQVTRLTVENVALRRSLIREDDI